VLPCNAYCNKERIDRKGGAFRTPAHSVKWRKPDDLRQVQAADRRADEGARQGWPVITIADHAPKVRVARAHSGGGKDQQYQERAEAIAGATLAGRIRLAAEFSSGFHGARALDVIEERETLKTCASEQTQSTTSCTLQKVGFNLASLERSESKETQYVYRNRHCRSYLGNRPLFKKIAVAQIHCAASPKMCKEKRPGSLESGLFYTQRRPCNRHAATSARQAGIRFPGNGVLSTWDVLTYARCRNQ